MLADGRLAISGGEYNDDGPYQLQLTNLGAIYDPVKNTWTPLGHPTKWGFIGDSPNTVLPNGQFLVGQKLTKRDAYLDPKTLEMDESFRRPARPISIPRKAGRCFPTARS